MRKLEREYHPRCLFYGKMNGVRVSFDENGGMTAIVGCDVRCGGYEGRMHGGVISALFDWAMTHCLFGRGIKAYTARLNVKYSRPVATGTEATISVMVEGKHNERVWRVRSSLAQKRKVCASATALFWEESNGNGTGGSA